MNKTILMYASFIFLLTGSKSFNTQDILCNHHAKQATVFELPTGYVIEKTIHQDFDNNAIDDYIYLAFSETELTSKEFWVKDDGQLFLEIADIPSQNYHYFINVDDDNEKEVIIIRGEEDYSDAKIANINLQNKSLDTLFYFNPVIYKNNNYYWGYYWAVDNLLLRANHEVYSSYHVILHDSEKLMAKNQSLLPTLIFSANDDFANDGMELQISDAKYRSIDDIKEFSFNGNNK